ncbi:uncharacterized protein L3040_003082 [Drepanopeziza brunnea f. sp. 'multigermtubi']|uniref:Uncharacterized protein n=1 Tax=Marssonina brunnea f. sp. multigermtubi (strain MB_m1) TaxID=1072389 RepID=K1W5V1_MARBU|nr:uncharacterized protein MBM_09490 [Drepanopeziza brunnea f. sp. 'multigermtubi' MB_m1]EKD12315.1 hypothetical protein MBM_09490 [Drepanopeziza brunnea f. sp. 'multigermtubi' MB_m1]KAJ5047243.1 hypothetical protein L3040_003082 [Drepanopeziza brunnea f. sp. 'multigermtubi']
MVSIKTLLVVAFISLVSAKPQSCTCVDSDEAERLCSMLQNVKMLYGRCLTANEKATAEFSTLCDQSDKNRFGAYCRDLRDDESF